MIETVREYIEKNDLLRPEDAVIAAVSGGADSLCLLEILWRLGYSVTAVHVQHHLRESAEHDAVFTEEFCGKRGIPFVRKDVDVRARQQCTGEGPEEAARALRYSALEEERKKAEEGGRNAVIALAHHRNDQAETVLFHLIRGTGLRGASGMRPKNGHLVRPLLGVTRSEIEAWMEAEGLTYCGDETNDLPDATRNRIRLQVIPELVSIRADAVEQIAGAADGFREIEDYLDRQAKRWLEAHPGTAEEGTELPDALLEEDPALIPYVIRAALRDAGFSLKDLTREHVKDTAGLFGKQVGKRIPLPGNLLAERTYRGVLLRKAFTGPEGRIPGPIQLKLRRFPHQVGEKIPEKEYTKWFDCDRIKGKVSLRFRESGDLFSTREGTHKKLKDWMIDEKIPAGMRDRIPLIADEEEVLWVPGFRRGESKKVTAETKEILEITVQAEAVHE